MTTKVHSIKAVTNFRTMTPDVVFTTANGALTGVYNNPSFAGAPAQPVDQPTLQAANNALAAANSAAANGGKKELELQKKDKEVVVKILVQLAHWAEANCKDDMTTFLSSGFQAASSAKTKTPPVSEAIRKIAFGSVSGSVVLTLVKFKGAAVTISNLTPRTNLRVPGSRRHRDGLQRLEPAGNEDGCLRGLAKLNSAVNCVNLHERNRHN